MALYSSLPHASVESLQKESYGGKKKIFPTTSGKYPGRGGKKLIFFSWTIVLGTVVLPDAVSTLGLQSKAQQVFLDFIFVKNYVIH